MCTSTVKTIEDWGEYNGNVVGYFEKLKKSDVFDFSVKRILETRKSMSISATLGVFDRGAWRHAKKYGKFWDDKMCNCCDRTAGEFVFYNCFKAFADVIDTDLDGMPIAMSSTHFILGNNVYCWIEIDPLVFMTKQGVIFDFNLFCDKYGYFFSSGYYTVGNLDGKRTVPLGDLFRCSFRNNPPKSDIQRVGTTCGLMMGIDCVEYMRQNVNSRVGINLKFANERYIPKAQVCRPEIAAAMDQQAILQYMLDKRDQMVRTGQLVLIRDEFGNATYTTPEQAELMSLEEELCTYDDEGLDDWQQYLADEAAGKFESCDEDVELVHLPSTDMVVAVSVSEDLQCTGPLFHNEIRLMDPLEFCSGVRQVMSFRTDTDYPELLLSGTDDVMAAVVEEYLVLEQSPGGVDDLRPLYIEQLRAGYWDKNVSVKLEGIGIDAVELCVRRLTLDNGCSNVEIETLIRAVRSALIYYWDGYFAALNEVCVSSEAITGYIFIKYGHRVIDMLISVICRRYSSLQFSTGMQIGSKLSGMFVDSFSDISYTELGRVALRLYLHIDTVFDGSVINKYQYDVCMTGDAYKIFGEPDNARSMAIFGWYVKYWPGEVSCVLDMLGVYLQRYKCSCH